MASRPNIRILINIWKIWHLLVCFHLLCERNIAIPVPSIAPSLEAGRAECEMCNVKAANKSLVIFLSFVAGLYSLDIDEYELVIPTKVTEDGQFLSHDLNHHHRNGEQELYFKTPGHGRRNKRSTEAVVNYHIPVGILGHKQPLHLELWPSSDFFAPGLVVERRTANLSAPRLSPPSVRATRCHYQGAIRGQPGSQVAVSACNGLVSTPALE